MSIQAMLWAIKQPIDLPGAKLALIILSNYADSEGYSFPSQRVLAEECSLTERGVRKMLDMLEELGLIAREERPGRGRRLGYRLVGLGFAVENPVEREAENGESDRNDVPVTPAPEGGDRNNVPVTQAVDNPSDRNVVPGRPERGSGRSIDSDSDPVTDPKSGARAREAAPAPPPPAADADVGGAALGEDGAWAALWPVLPKREGDDERKTRLQWAIAIAGGAKPEALQLWAEAYAAHVERSGTKPWHLPSTVTVFREQHWRRSASAAVGPGVPERVAVEWRIAREQIAAVVGAVDFGRWLGELELIAGDAGFVRLHAKSLFFRDHVRARYGPVLERITGKRVEVVFAGGKAA